MMVSFTDGKLDPLQSAYRTSKGVNDAKLFILDKVYKHLEKSQSHARILFADFLCTFNKMQPHILFDCLASYFELPNQFLVLLLNFLTNRIQWVLVNGRVASIRLSSTGSPQGCVLSPVLFILYTDSCRSSQEGSFVIVKFSDDTALLTVLQGRDSDHGQALPILSRLKSLKIEANTELIVKRGQQRIHLMRKTKIF